MLPLFTPLFVSKTLVSCLKTHPKIVKLKALN
jgi:hypothetical protein